MTWLTPLVPLIGGRTQFTLDLVAFVFGYLLYSSGRMIAAVRRLAYVTLGLAVVLWVAVLTMLGTGIVPANAPTAPSMLLSLVLTFGIWMLLLATLGLALRYLTVAPSWQRYLTVATFPLFVLHAPLLIVAATYLQALPGPWYLHLVLISLVTIAGGFVLYEYVVRRIPVTRFLFGLDAPRSTRNRTVTLPLPSEEGAPTGGGCARQPIEQRAGSASLSDVPAGGDALANPLDRRAGRVR